MLTEHSTAEIRFYVFSIGGNGQWAFQKITGNYTSSISPSKVIVEGGLIYAYYEGVVSDEVFVTNLASDLTSIITLNKNNCNITVTPDRQKVILWSKLNSELYVHALNSSFTQLNNFNSLLTNSTDVPEAVSVSADSQLVLIEYNTTHNPVVMSISNGSVVHNISCGNSKYGATFLDPSSRFVLIKTSGADVVYDLETSLTNSYQLNAYIPNTKMEVDYVAGMIYTVHFRNYRI